MDGPSIEGTYTARDGSAFTYEASWTSVGSRVAAWYAIVRRDGEEIGRPYGQIVLARGTGAAVAIAVRNSIEKGFQRSA